MAGRTQGRLAQRGRMAGRGFGGRESARGGSRFAAGNRLGAGRGMGGRMGQGSGLAVRALGRADDIALTAEQRSQIEEVRQRAERKRARNDDLITQSRKRSKLLQWAKTGRTS